MADKNLKIEIQKVIDNIPETVLEEVLIILKDIESKSKTASDDILLEKILEEDKSLLKRLAQS